MFDQKYRDDIIDIFEKGHGNYYKPNQYLNEYYWFAGLTHMMVDYKYLNLLVARFVSEYILALQKVYKRDPPKDL